MSDKLADYRVAGEGKETLFFLHGLGGDHTNWIPQFDAFAADYRCIAWTMPGYAGSPGMDVMTWPDLGDAAVRVLNDVGIESATMIGLSMGGYIAQQIAADHEERVDRLVLAGTTAQFGRGSASFAEKFLASRLEPIEQGAKPADFAASVVEGLLSDDAHPDAASTAIASMSRISPHSYRQALECLVTWNMKPFLDEIEAPTLCIAGANDKTAPVEAMQELADGIPNARLEVLDNCNHLMNLDRPTAFNQVVNNFLTE